MWGKIFKKNVFPGLRKYRTGGYGRVGVYTDHAGLKIPVDLYIAALFSQPIAIGNGGPASALEPMGAKPTLPFFEYWSNVQTVSEKKYILGNAPFLGLVCRQFVHCFMSRILLYLESNSQLSQISSLPYK